MSSVTEENLSHVNSPRVQKPPPIFVSGVEEMKLLIQQLDLTAKDDYDIRILQNDEVKIQPKTPESYSAIIKDLAKKETRFHTFQLKQDRSYKVVLKNMYHKADTNEIKSELLKKGHIVRNVSNIREKITKKPLPMFFVELAPKENNKDIYAIDLLLQCRVRFEPPHQKREVVQCMNCQMYGHTKRFCYHDPRCVKCAGDHATSECPRKVKSEDVKCVLCQGKHPANYKGCVVYKEIQKQKFPAPRSKQYAPTIPEASLISKPTERALGSLNQVKPGISYAQAATGMKIPQLTSRTYNTPQQPQTQDIQQSNGMAELQKMLKSLMEQMNTMLNLLTVLVTKMT
jgi:hypothetical protein